MAKLINAGDPLDEDFAKGPDIGDLVPDFTLPDQRGESVNLATARGDGKALILFYRSASW
jgi:peroxiredoxin